MNSHGKESEQDGGSDEEDDDSENDDDDDEEEDTEKTEDVGMVPMADMLNARYETENVGLHFYTSRPILTPAAGKTLL